VVDVWNMKYWQRRSMQKVEGLIKKKGKKRMHTMQTAAGIK